MEHQEMTDDDEYKDPWDNNMYRADSPETIITNEISTINDTHQELTDDWNHRNNIGEDRETSERHLSHW
jgi:hypothetical protein